MTPTTIARYRLARQQLGATQTRSAVEMVEWLGAVQGQEYAQTKWELGLRLPHLKDRDIESELNQGNILINQALLQKEEVDGHVYFYHADMPVADQPSKSMFLLPMYDELIMGYKDRSAIMQLKGDALSRYGCMLVYDGQVIGTWKRSLSNTKVELAYDFFRPLDPAQDKAFELAIAQLGEFTGLKVVREKSMPC